MGMYTPYLGPSTADPTRLASAPPYKMHIAPALSKNPKLYKKPSPPVASAEPYIGLA